MATPRDPTQHVFELTSCFGVRLDEARIPELCVFYDQCSDYVELVTGAPPGPNDAEELVRSLPRGKTADDKFVVGLFDAPGHIIGVLDIIRDFPAVKEWYFGLLLLGPSSRGRGLGERVYRRLEEWVRAEGGRAIHLIVHEQNPGALRFWKRMGFEERGFGKQILKHRTNVYIRMTRELDEKPESTGTFIESWRAAWRRARGG